MRKLWQILSNGYFWRRGDKCTVLYFNFKWWVRGRFRQFPKPFEIKRYTMTPTPKTR